MTHQLADGAQPPLDYAGQQPSIEAQVQTGLNLFLPLKNPAQMPALMQAIAAHMPAVRAALKDLHYVHFARFLPTQDYATLIVVTEFDGDLKSYIMDFVAVMGDIFTAMLQFVEGAPRLPVQKYPADFWDFVQRHNMTQAQPWSAYGQSTVIELLGRQRPLRPAAPDAAPATLDLKDIQGNILRGYRAQLARHFVLQVSDAAAARRFVGLLVSGDAAAAPQVSTAEHWADSKPPYSLNLGLTHDGLAALGLPTATLALFPQAFREGPAQRAIRYAQARAKGEDCDVGNLGDAGDCAPEHWRIGQPGMAAHLMLSLFTDGQPDGAMATQTTRLRALFAAHGLVEVAVQDAQALPEDRVHFGYRDSIAQPRIAGSPGADQHGRPDLQPKAGAGEFLLGKDYVNQYGGNFAGDLPPAIADNGSYAAVRLYAQDVAAFERTIAEAAKTYGCDPEWIAAKLMGRWRDGSPLTLAPDAPQPQMSDARINHYDYAPNQQRPDGYDDAAGLRCPLGSHTRRMNPRGALVTGKPHSRRLIRRGMPYGPAWQAGQADDGVERGLVGLFICGDLEMQYEFLLAKWANTDLATAGLNGTQDPIIGAQDAASAGRFEIPTDDRRNPIRVMLPRLVRTRGSLYVFLPGINALRTLAALPAARPAAVPAAQS